MMNTADAIRTGELPPLLVQAHHMVAKAEASGVCIRLTGSLGVRSHCHERADLFRLLGREQYGDIDFIGKSKERSRITDLFKSMGYEPDLEMVRAEEFGTQRLIFEQPDKKIKVDVFLDQLQMCHTLDFRKRLELDTPTIALVDLLLAKLQIHDITAKDLIDIAVLLAEHPIGQGPETIDETELLRRLGDDWGFWESATRNLALVAEYLERWNGPGPTKSELLTAVRHASELMAACPKSVRWRLRAKLGTRVPWYQEVEDVAR
jgi:hypothetical protein